VQVIEIGAADGEGGAEDDAEQKPHVNLRGDPV
jgi:hypothetical protein